MIYENNRILLSVLSMCWVFQFICGIIKEATWFFQNLFQLYRLYFLNIIKVADCLCWLTSGLEWPSISSELMWDKYKCYTCLKQNFTLTIDNISLNYWRITRPGVDKVKSKGWLKYSTPLLKWQSGKNFDPRTGILHIVRDP